MQDPVQDAQLYLNTILKKTREQAIRTRLQQLRKAESDKFLTKRFLELLLPENFVTF